MKKFGFCFWLSLVLRALEPGYSLFIAVQVFAVWILDYAYEKDGSDVGIFIQSVARCLFLVRLSKGAQ